MNKTLVKCIYLTLIKNQNNHQTNQMHHKKTYVSLMFLDTWKIVFRLQFKYIILRFKVCSYKQIAF